MINKTKMRMLMLIFVVSIQGISSNTSISPKLSLWYEQPATEWMEALPLGNGRLGFMVYGGIEEETIALNEITMWSGQQDKFQERPCGKETLNDLRQLFFERNYDEGNRLASDILAGTPHSFGSHVPLGDLKIRFNHPEGKISQYKRELNIENAVNEVIYRVGNVQFKREYICSNPDDALIVRLTANKKEAINCDISLELLRDADIYPLQNGLGFEGKVDFPRQGPGGVHFAGKVGVSVDGGELKIENEKLVISRAQTVTIVFDTRTDLKNENYKTDTNTTVDNILKQPYNQLKSRHIRDYKNLFDRVELSFGKSASDYLPTNIRWEQVKTGKNDIGLDALFFHYGRYLLIASSRENSPLPTNLQGIWNDNLACNSGWTNDYHLDINTQQNYWLSDIVNLGECNQPLFDYIKDLSVWGQKTAQRVYGARGWTANTVANVWGYTASGNGTSWGLFPTASSWIASHLWTHYLYTLDEKFLAEKAYPVLKSNAEFLLDYMVVHPENGYLMTGPSTSPENSFIYEGKVLALSMMPTCDRVLAYEAFSSCAKAAEILNKDALFRDTLNHAIQKLPPFFIGKNGGLQEWFEDYEEASPNHRHTSHLMALYPFNQITLDKTPDLAKAALQTIELRLSAEGWEDVEWSRANAICNYARLKNPAEAYNSVVEMQRLFARENMLTISPEGIGGAPSDIFVFDGNQAAPAGIAEMLLQCHEGYIAFLPALPQEWHTGYFKGLCVKGGGIIDLKWVNGKVTAAKLKAVSNNSFRLKMPQSAKKMQFTKNGKSFNLTPDADGFIEVSLSANEFLEFK